MINSTGMTLNSFEIGELMPFKIQDESAQVDRYLFPGFEEGQFFFFIKISEQGKDNFFD